MTVSRKVVAETLAKFIELPAGEASDRGHYTYGVPHRVVAFFDAPRSIGPVEEKLIKLGLGQAQHEWSWRINCNPELIFRTDRDRNQMEIVHDAATRALSAYMVIVENQLISSPPSA